jgi:hypothetical protein
MAEFPPAQYIQGYSATGNTISFTIAGNTGKKVASVTVTDGGSYTTPTASVAFSGGSGSGASATVNMALKGITFSSTGASGLVETASPESVSIQVSGASGANPLFGLASVSPNVDMFYDISTTPTVSVSGPNGTYSDAVISSLDSSSGLHVASLVTPATGSGNYKRSDESSVQIVDSANTSVVLGTATINADNEGQLSDDIVILNSWATGQAKSTLQGYSLKLKSIEPSFELTSFTKPTNTSYYFKTDGTSAPSLSITNQTPYYNGGATFTIPLTSCVPATFTDLYNGLLFIPDENVTIRRQHSGNNQPTVATVANGQSTFTWLGSTMTWQTASDNSIYEAISVATPTAPALYELRIRTVKSTASPEITWNNRGRYDTQGIEFAINNIHTDPSCETLATNSSFSYSVVSSTTAQISTSSFAIKALKMPVGTASSRISVTSAGNGYTELLQVQSTNLKTEADLTNNVQSGNFDQKLLLKDSSIQGNGGIYASAPTITVSGGGISNSNVVKTIIYKADNVAITNTGLDYLTSPSVSFTGSVSSGGTNATGTTALSENPAISLPDLSEANANPTTGDFRVICHALCELIEGIDTNSVRTTFETSLQPSFTGVIERYTFIFDISPESGELVMDPEP